MGDKDKKIQELTEEIILLREENRLLKEWLNQLDCLLGLGYSETSSKPPSKRWAEEKAKAHVFTHEREEPLWGNN